MKEIAELKAKQEKKRLESEVRRKLTAYSFRLDMIIEVPKVFPQLI